MQVIGIESADSTNNWVAENEKNLPSPVLVYCKEQKAGRGQRGNSWESEPGKNITASLLCHPEEFPAICQFAISEAVALAVTDFLRGYGVETKVKWPNDIYHGDKKICGILVEHVVIGNQISRTIAGIGININQTKFISDAPNPVSLKIITGKQHDIEECVAQLATILENYMKTLRDKERLHREFLTSLWRNDGNFYKFHDRQTGETIYACIKDVDSRGILSLLTTDGESRSYAFKEIEFIL